MEANLVPTDVPPDGFLFPPDEFRSPSSGVEAVLNSLTCKIFYQSACRCSRVNVACYAVLMRANEPETDSVCPQLHCSTMFVKISWISFTSLTNLSLISLTSLTHLPHISHPSPSHLSLISFTSLTHLPHISHSSPSHLSPISLTSLIHLPLSLISLRILNFKRQLYSICDCEWEKGHLPHFIVFYFSTLLDCPIFGVHNGVLLVAIRVAVARLQLVMRVQLVKKNFE